MPRSGPPAPAIVTVQPSLLAGKLGGVTIRRGPVWAGPCSTDDQGGVTQSLLGRFLCCRERFRLLVVDGLKAAERWPHKLGYGNMWHVCEEALAKHGSLGKGDEGGAWIRALNTHTEQELAENPLDRDIIEHWYCICRTQFPVYVKHWEAHPEVVGRTPLMQEEKFAVPYTLPSGRTIILRGKYDSVDLITTTYHGAKMQSVYLQENKTKGDLDHQQIERQLSFDLQSMFYLVALDETKKGLREKLLWEMSTAETALFSYPLRGVRYNCVRRPLSGGKHTVQQHQPTLGAKCTRCKGTGSDPKYTGLCQKCDGQCRVGAKPGETRDDFYARVGGIIASDPEWFFMRFVCEVSEHDLQAFRRQCLDPILEQLCVWWDEVCGRHAEAAIYKKTMPMSWRQPYGVYNPLNEGRVADVDGYLATGNTAGLRRVGDLFPELRG